MASLLNEPFTGPVDFEQPQLPDIARWAALALCQDFAKLQNESKQIPTHKADGYHLLPVATSLVPTQIRPTPEGYSVGIVGAGVAGMFTAMIFDYLNEKYKLNVKYEILEAEEKRVGGRLFTYKFPDPADPTYKCGDHDYYDVGAMRFPNIDVMARTFQLFKELKMDFHSNKKGAEPKPKAGDLIPYYMRGNEQPVLFNGVHIVQTKSQDDKGNEIWVPPLSADELKVPCLPINVSAQGAGDLAYAPIKDIVAKYKPGNEKAFWDELRETVDPYSARQYFTKFANYDYNTIEFMETVDFGCRWYDQAASEVVLETINFGSGTTDWHCVEQGATQIALRMHDKLANKQAVQFNKLVTAIGYKDDKSRTDVNVSVLGETTPRTYDAVFNSATLSAQQHMQLEGLKLNWGTKCAIRNLGYGASCKVGVRFKTLWWMDKEKTNLNINKGGVGKTDLPIHFCVYPSYNVNDDVDKPGVLLASYTWSQEAERVGSLISRHSPEGEQQLRQIITHDLARLHASDDEDFERLYKLIDEQWLDHYAYNWYANPLTGGAFAWFGPQQFSNLYNDITASDGRYMIIGEASSAHHGWVVGALESAVRGVYQFLYNAQLQLDPEAPASKAYDAYNKKDIPGPFGPLPAEFNRPQSVVLPADVAKELTGDEKNSIQHEIVSQGELARMGVLMEQIRLEQDRDTIDYSSITKNEIAPFLDLLPGPVARAIIEAAA